jgi:hypothetical protein
MSTNSRTHASPSMKSSPKKTTVPVHLLRSGWDHELDLRSPVGSLRSKRFSFFKKAESTRASTPSPSPPDDEAAFAQSTQNYLSSSAAQQLRLPAPPPPTRLQNYASAALPPKQSLMGTPITPAAAMDVDPIMPASPNSHDFLSDTWPRPPVMIPSVSPRGSSIFADPPRPSSPLSTRSSLGSTIVDALGAIPSHFRDAPFNVKGPGVAAVPVAQGSRGSMPHRPSTRKGPKKNDAVYMTVVHETVDGP